jgi:predicted regulator of amino acid metabolism with ACT domain
VALEAPAKAGRRDRVVVDVLLLFDVVVGVEFCVCCRVFVFGVFCVCFVGVEVLLVFVFDVVEYDVWGVVCWVGFFVYEFFLFVVRSPEGVASRLLIGGEENMPYRISSCCKPKLTDKMIAYITKVKGVSVHKVGCAFVAKASSERLLQVSMEKNVESKTAKNGYYVSLLLEMKEKQGYLKNIVEYFTKQNMLISSFDLIGKKLDLQQRKLVLDVVNEGQLNGMIEQLKSIDGVEDVSRM